jgi:propanol-preferring alcohol dehydrogenase
MLQIARRRYPESPVYVFARSIREQEFARELGATWAGDTDDAPPEPLTAIVDTTPAWRPVVRALDALAPGGRLIINAIRKVDADRDVLSELDYARHLWREKVIMSVANVTRHDIADCLALAAETGIRATVELYRLADANEALAGLGRGEIRGAKVLILE